MGKKWELELICFPPFLFPPFCAWVFNYLCIYKKVEKRIANNFIILLQRERESERSSKKRKRKKKLQSRPKLSQLFCHFTSDCFRRKERVVFFVVVFFLYQSRRPHSLSQIICTDEQFTFWSQFYHHITSSFYEQLLCAQIPKAQKAAWFGCLFLHFWDLRE